MLTGFIVFTRPREPPWSSGIMKLYPLIFKKQGSFLRIS